MEPISLNPSGVNPARHAGGSGAAKSKETAEDFKKLVDDYLQEVNQLQAEADGAVRDLATGKTENLHELMAAVNEADLSFRLMMEMRNKLMSAYKEIMQMRV